MNRLQKFLYTLWGAVIMAIGITIGAIVCSPLVAQENGFFDKVVCHELEVVDKDGKKAIVLQSNRGDDSANRVIIYDPENKRANVVGVELVSDEGFINSVRIKDKRDNDSTGVWLYSMEAAKINRVVAYQPGTSAVGVALASHDTYSGLYIKDEISLESSDKQNLIAVEDMKEVPKRAAFQIYSNDDGNYSSRWIRGRGRRANW